MRFEKNLQRYQWSIFKKTVYYYVIMVQRMMYRQNMGVDYFELKSDLEELYYECEEVLGIF